MAELSMPDPRRNRKKTSGISVTPATGHTPGKPDRRRNTNRVKGKSFDHIPKEAPPPKAAKPVKKKAAYSSRVKPITTTT